MEAAGGGGGGEALQSGLNYRMHTIVHLLRSVLHAPSEGFLPLPLDGVLPGFEGTVSDFLLWGDAEEVAQIRAGSARLRARRKLQSLVARTDTQRKKHHRRPPVVTFARPSRDWGKGGREGGQRTGDEEGDSPLLLQLVELVGA